jgi:hypothetical protein
MAYVAVRLRLLYANRAIFVRFLNVICSFLDKKTIGNDKKLPESKGWCQGEANFGMTARTVDHSTLINGFPGGGTSPISMPGTPE